MWAGFEGLFQLPEAINPQWPIPSELPSVSYKSGSPKAWPNSWQNTPIWIMVVLSQAKAGWIT
jgi:hypothetical protein